MNKYDYIIAGLGAAGLSLAYFIMQSKQLKGKKVLLVDRDRKDKNDRTWTFWGDVPGEFAHLVEKTWHKIGLHDKYEDVIVNAERTPYHFIPAIRFYNYVIPKLKKSDNFTFLSGNIERISDLNGEAVITIDSQRYSADYIFNSAFHGVSTMAQAQKEIAFQQFKGWEVSFNREILEADEVTLMDFSISEKGKVNFMYLLPVSENRLILNYTAFGSEMMENGFAEKCMADYLAKYFPHDYSIIRKEQGFIPMSHIEFKRNYSSRIMNLGILGGDARPSTGYTFINTINNSRKIAAGLAESGNPPKILNNKRHFNFYDRIFIRVLKDNPEALKKALLLMFKKNSPSKAFDFLSASTSVIQEIPIILSLPIIPFLKAFINEQKNSRR